MRQLSLIKDWLLCRCLLDTKPRQFTPSSAAILNNFSELVIRELEAAWVESTKAEGTLLRGAQSYSQPYLIADMAHKSGRVLHMSKAAQTLTGEKISLHNFNTHDKISHLITSTRCCPGIVGFTQCPSLPPQHDLRVCYHAVPKFPATDFPGCSGAGVSSQGITSLDDVFLFGDEKASTPTTYRSEPMLSTEQHSSA